MYSLVSGYNFNSSIQTQNIPKDIHKMYVYVVKHKPYINDISSSYLILIKLKATNADKKNVIQCFKGICNLQTKMETTLSTNQRKQQISYWVDQKKRV